MLDKEQPEEENQQREGKQTIFKSCAPFANCISEINNIQVGNAKDLDIVMPMHNILIIAKISVSLWQYYRDEPADNITFWNIKFKSGFMDNTGNNNTVNVKIVISLKYFWETLEILLFNSEINLILTCSVNRVICELKRATSFTITDAKVYVPIVTLSTKGNS